MANGTYWVQPAGTAYQTQCTDGFALAMRINQEGDTFGFFSSYWTNIELLNPYAVTSAENEAKLQTFVDMPGSVVRLAMCKVDGPCGSTLDVEVGAFASLLALFSNGTSYTSVPLTAWDAAVPGGGVSLPNCNMQGVNIDTSSVCSSGGTNFRTAYRLGLITNGENECCSSDSSIGVGGYSAYYGAVLNGNMCYCNGYGQYRGQWPGTGTHTNVLVGGAVPSCVAVLSTTPVVTPTPSNTPNPSCLPSAFHLLPGSDLAGALLSTSLTSSPNEHMCALTCCSTPGCEGYTWSSFALSNPCFLFANVTAQGINVLTTSGVFPGAVLFVPVSATPSVTPASPTVTTTPTPCPLGWFIPAGSSVCWFSPSGSARVYTGSYNWQSGFTALSLECESMWPGHGATLASITSDAEASFVIDQMCGTTDHQVWWSSSNSLALGGYKVNVNATRTSGWSWADGSPTDYLFSDSGLELGLWDLATPLSKLQGYLVWTFGAGLRDNTDLSPGGPLQLAGHQPCCSAPRPISATGTPSSVPSPTPTRTNIIPGHPPVRYVRFVGSPPDPTVGAQEVQLYTDAGENIAMQSHVTAGPYVEGLWGSYQGVVDGVWQYRYPHHTDNQFVWKDRVMWFMLDLGAAVTSLTHLNLFVNYAAWHGDGWYPGDMIEFLDGDSNVFFMYALPSNWTAVPMPYVLNITSLFSTDVPPTSTATATASPTPTPTNNIPGHPPVRYVRFTGGLGQTGIGMQEMQLITNNFINVALQCGVLSRVSGSDCVCYTIGSLDGVVDGIWQYAYPTTDNQINWNGGGNNEGWLMWLEFDLGAVYTSLATLNLFVNQQAVANVSDASTYWYPGQIVTFYDGSHNAQYTTTLPSAWTEVPMPYVLNLTSLFATGVPPSTTPAVSPTPSPGCAPLYRALPRMDLVGTLVGTPKHPSTSFPSPSESGCRQSCCDSPVCDAYTFAASDLQNAIFQGQSPFAQCFLYANVTALVPSSAFASGAMHSAYS